MTDAKTAARTPDRLSRGLEAAGPMEWLMIGLAAVNVLLLFAADAYAAFLPQLVLQLVIPIDLAFVALFGLEFLVRLVRASNRVRFVQNHWYDLVALLPAASIGIRSLRLLRLVRVLVVRDLQWEREPSWMTALLRGGIRGIRTILLEEITGPIVVAGIGVVKVPLRKARFAEAIGHTLDTQRREVHAVVRTTLRNTKGIKNVASNAVVERLTVVITDTVMDSVVETMRSDEMNELLANSIEGVMDEALKGLRGGQVSVDLAAADAGAAAAKPA